MDTNDQHQIATEAANQAWNDGLIDQNGKTPLKFIIQAAIEKATEENNLAWGRRIGEKDNEIRALQAELRAASHASEQYPSVGNFVRYANSLYEVAEIRLFPHGYMVGIFDEPPSKHIDYINLANLEQQTAHASEDEKDLTAVPVLAETARPGICDATTEGGEARESTETIGRDLPVKQDYRGGSQPL